MQKLIPFMVLLVLTSHAFADTFEVKGLSEDGTPCSAKVELTEKRQILSVQFNGTITESEIGRHAGTNVVTNTSFRYTIQGDGTLRHEFSHNILNNGFTAKQTVDMGTVKDFVKVDVDIKKDSIRSIKFEEGATFALVKMHSQTGKCSLK